MDKKGGSIKIFPRNFFCLTEPKNFVGEPVCAVFLKPSDSEKVYGIEGGSIKIFRQNFLFVSQCRKFSGGGESFSVSLILGIEKVRIRGWEYQSFPSKNVCLTTSKNFVRETFPV